VKYFNKNQCFTLLKKSGPFASHIGNMIAPQKDRDYHVRGGGGSQTIDCYELNLELEKGRKKIKDGSIKSEALLKFDPKNDQVWLKLGRMQKFHPLRLNDIDFDN